MKDRQMKTETAEEVPVPEGGYTEQEYLYWLCQAPAFGTVKIHRLWEHYGSFRDIYYIEGKELEEEKLVSGRDAETFDSHKGKLGNPVCQRAG